VKIVKCTVGKRQNMRFHTAQIAILSKNTVRKRIQAISIRIRCTPKPYSYLS